MRLPLGQSEAVGRQFINLDTELAAAIVRTVEAGWEIAVCRSEVSPIADEVTITECLRDAMRTALVRCQLPWRKSMIVAPGTESRSQPGMTAPDGRTDIPLYLTPIFAQSDEHDPHAILECKRVAEGNATLAREYVVEGIDRFRTGKYGENHGRGFMVGYVVAGTRIGAVEGINSYLTGRARSSEMLALVSSEDTTESWTSQHKREAERLPIILHHAMLAVA